MNRAQLSKLMCLVLRHKPHVIGIEIDEGGWTDLDGFIDALNEARSLTTHVVRELIEEIVATDEKGRYAIDGNRIRANQGHSLPYVKIDFEPGTPPEVLYHGAVGEMRMEIIRSGGLRPMTRHHVHLSETVEDAKTVAKRRKGKTPMVLKVHAVEMAAEGIEFSRSANGVWLVDSVPNRFLEFPEGRLREKTAAGGVLFREEDGSVDIALLLKERKGVSTWELPKGGVEKGEQIEAAALREVREETGVVPDPALIVPLGQSLHTFRKRKMLVAKTTHYFLFRPAEHSTFLPQREEGFIGIQWFPLAEAVRTVSYENLRPIIRSCRKHI